MKMAVGFMYISKNWGGCREKQKWHLLPVVLGLALSLYTGYSTGSEGPATMSGDSGLRVPVREGALAEFVQEPDRHYGWQVLGTETQAGVRAVNMTMTSQRWSPAVLTSATPLWHHRMTVYIPDVAREEHRSSLGILHINGGTRHSRDGVKGPEVFDDMNFRALARMTGTIVVDLKDIPNQYLRLKGERPRKEDDLIARSWEATMRHPRCTDCALQFPMTKAAVRAMDAVQEMLQEQAPKRFVLTGGSKRGWVAWLASAVDNRVSAVIPMVIDTLNVQACLDHIHQIYGHWIPPLQPYQMEGQNVMAQLRTPAMDQLMQHVDPWSYRDSLTLPKYVITASGDDFFPPDNSRFYWSGLKGEKWLRTYPNSRHYITRENSARVTDTVAGFVGYIVADRQPPTMKADRLTINGGRISLSRAPDSMRLWQATHPKARDFRMTTLEPAGLKYTAKEMPVPCHQDEDHSCVVEVEVDKPEAGWTAWFMEFTYKNQPYPDFVMTSPVLVTPDTYPVSDSAQ